MDTRSIRSIALNLFYLKLCLIFSQRARNISSLGLWSWQGHCLDLHGVFSPCCKGTPLRKSHMEDNGQAWLPECFGQSVSLLWALGLSSSVMTLFPCGWLLWLQAAGGCDRGARPQSGHCPHPEGFSLTLCLSTFSSLLELAGFTRPLGLTPYVDAATQGHCQPHPSASPPSWHLPWLHKPVVVHVYCSLQIIGAPVGERCYRGARTPVT